MARACHFKHGDNGQRTGVTPLRVGEEISGTSAPYGTTTDGSDKVVHTWKFMFDNDGSASNGVIVSRAIR